MSDAKLPTLEDVAHEQTNVLFDVIAMLEGAKAMLFVSSEESPLDHDIVERIINQARDRTQSVIDALTPHI